jgi:SpoVK/Ycf46/Vps4 family AAA+-type ATPase
MSGARKVLVDQVVAQPFEDDLDYLQHELEWLEVRCWRLAAERVLERVVEKSPERRRRHYGRDEEENPGTLRAKIKRLVAEEQKHREAIDARLEVHRRGEAPAVALDEVCEMYGLDGFERNVLLMAAAVAFSQRFDEYYGELLQESFGAHLSVEVTFAFHELSFAESVRRRSTYSPRSPLVANDLVAVDLHTRMMSPQDLLNARISVANRTFAQLVGKSQLLDEFLEFSSVEEPRASLENVVLDIRDKERVMSVVERHDEYLRRRKEWGFDDIISYGRGALMLFYGPPGTGKTLMAHAVAKSMNKRVLNVDIPTFVNHRDAQRFLPGLFREARLQDAILFFDECEVLFSDRRGGNDLMTILLTEIERFEGVAVLATNMPQMLDEALDRRILVKVHFPEPDREARREIWKKHIPAGAPIADDVDLDMLAARYELTGGYIKNAMLMAVADAVHRGHESPVITMASIEKAALEQLRRPGQEDSGMVQPNVRLSQVVMTAALKERVEELVEATRDRRLVLETWGIGQHMSYGKGTSALFHGPPGTGKTLCAEAIAGELNRPLIVASMPTIVSKWVGQTERNLEQLFNQARMHGAVLFLDEADSLLMARGEGRASRHDDAIVNGLLTLIERHDGLVLLATNRPGALDAALERRLTYRLEFALPSQAMRAEIWRKLLPETVPGAEEIDFDRLGSRYAMSGGLIKNAVFKAAFRAARRKQSVTQGLLEEAAGEETAGETKGNIGFGTG